MTDIPNYEKIGIVLGVIATFGIWSFLFGDNKFYRALEHLALGLGAGYTVATTWKDSIKPLWWDRLMAGLGHWEGSHFTNFAPNAGLLWLLVGVLGLFWYFQYSRKYEWLSRITVGVVMGASAGAAFKGRMLELLPQLTKSAQPLIQRAELSPGVYGHIDYGMTLTAVISFIATITVMSYFFFSFRQDGKFWRGSNATGKFFLMIMLGAFFGNTIMTRMAIFLDRVQYILDSAAKAHSF